MAVSVTSPSVVAVRSHSAPKARSKSRKSASGERFLAERSSQVSPSAECRVGSGKRAPPWPLGPGRGANEVERSSQDEVHLALLTGARHHPCEGRVNPDGTFAPCLGKLVAPRRCAP